MFVLKEKERMNECGLYLCKKRMPSTSFLKISNSGFATRLQISTASIHIMYHVQKTIMRFRF
jgi:hypothetical protein